MDSNFYDNCEKSDRFLSDDELEAYEGRHSKTISIVIEFVKKSVQVKLHMN